MPVRTVVFLIVLIFIDWSAFTVITAGLIKFSSEYDLSFLICLSSISFLNSFLPFLLGEVVFVFLCVALDESFFKSRFRYMVF